MLVRVRSIMCVEREKEIKGGGADVTSNLQGAISLLETQGGQSAILGQDSKDSSSGILRNGVLLNLNGKPTYFPHITLPSKHSISILRHSISGRWEQLRTSATLTNRWRAHSKISPFHPPAGPKGRYRRKREKGKIGKSLCISSHTSLHSSPFEFPSIPPISDRRGDSAHPFEEGSRKTPADFRNPSPANGDQCCSSEQ